MAPIGMFSAAFPPAPKFTEVNLPSLTGKVYIVTGAASGVGYELTKMLYSAGGTVYIAARSSERCEGAIKKLLAGKKATTGKLYSMVMDLEDLKSVKSAVSEFLSKESRLDALVHNAGVMTPPAGSKDKLGHDLEMGVHCLAPYLMTLLLEPILIKTATSTDAKPSTVRIVFVVSLLSHGTPPGAMTFQADGVPVIRPKAMDNYMQSKVGSAWLAAEFAERLGKHGILSVSLHPGFMKSELQRHMSGPGKTITGLMFKPAKYGAYSELYAGFSPEVTAAHNGGHLMAWGRLADMPKEVARGLTSQKSGGTGAARQFLDYCDVEVKDFL